MRRLVLYTCLSLLFFSCNNSNDTPIDDAINLTTPDQEMLGTDSVQITRTFKTASGQSIRVEMVKPDSAISGLVSIMPINFARGIELKYKADSITNFLQGDLDKDGFDELYLVTRESNKSEDADKSGLIAIASNQDNSLEPILFTDSIPAGLPAGMAYKGQDGYSIQDSLLIRTFPLFQSKDDKITDQIYQINYTLKADSTKWQLIKSYSGLKK